MKETTRSGRTPLTLASRKGGNSKTVKLLLDKGADAKERNERGVNPIQVAAACDDLDTVKLLVEAGADVNDFTEVSGRVEGMEMSPLPKRDRFAALTKDEVELARAWIEQGAVWPDGMVLGSCQCE